MKPEIRDHFEMRAVDRWLDDLSFSSQAEPSVRAIPLALLWAVLVVAGAGTLGGWLLFNPPIAPAP